ncbi:hypothetical protein SCHPADRAFT_891992 [Schizopora paradoxa]|uniref:Uncharacterized protein n=1 Tax=Schizopora paradoxa TaxID=27342 RepID=A0A0H2RNC3_9AGAM|nr:hypothetical protein SCHPADRAFT_891992 [Schizopora paradoxa]
MPVDQKVFCWYRRMLSLEKEATHLLPVYRVFGDRSLAFKIFYHLPANDLRSLSWTSSDFLEMVRICLRKQFVWLLKRFSIPSSFIDVMRMNNIVLSGSAIFHIINPELVGRWAVDEVAVGDLDIYVRNGSLRAVMDFLDNIPGVICTVVYSNVEAGPTSLTVEQIFRDARSLYWLPGVSSVTRLMLQDQIYPYASHQVDVIESSTPTPLYPITQFSFTHLQNALSADGLIMLNPKHTFSFQSIIKPNLLVGYNKAHLPDKYRASFTKNTLRGFSIAFHAMDLPYESSHLCGTSFSCPQTLRNTEDRGTFFLPFSASAYKRRMEAKRVHCPTIMWRVGGDPCDAYKYPTGLASCSFLAPALNEQFDSILSSDQ